MSKPTEPMGQAAIDALPPPGDARREELKRRDDVLAEQAAASLDERVDPAALHVDNEIAIQVVRTRRNRLEVRNAQPGYIYLLCRAYDDFGRPRPELVDIYRSIEVSIDGVITPAWEIVSGDMPEAPEWRDIAGQRRCGDCILLRCRQDVAEALDRFDREEQDRLNGKKAEEFAETVQRTIAGAQVRTWQTPESSGLISGRDIQRARREAAHRGALTQFDTMLRAGTVPGMPPERVPR